MSDFKINDNVSYSIDRTWRTWNVTAIKLEPDADQLLKSPRANANTVSLDWVAEFMDDHFSVFRSLRAFEDLHMKTVRA